MACEVFGVVGGCVAEFGSNGVDRSFGEKSDEGYGFFVVVVVASSRPGARMGHEKQRLDF